jgi:hypothetical protein
MSVIELWATLIAFVLFVIVVVDYFLCSRRRMAVLREEAMSEGRLRAKREYNRKLSKLMSATDCEDMKRMLDELIDEHLEMEDVE